MLAIKQILIDGTEIDLGRRKVSNDDIKIFVESGSAPSYMEPVRIDYSRRKYEPGVVVMMVHEEGLLRGLAFNKKATELYHAGRKGIPDKIVGNVVLIEWEEDDI